MRKLSTLLLLFGAALSLWAQDTPRRFVELGFDAGGSFANSYLTTGDIFRERIVLDLSELARKTGNGLEVFLGSQGEAFVNVNLGARWSFGFFAGVDAMGQFTIPRSMVELLAEGNDPNRTYSDKLGLGAAVFFETGFRVSAKIRRITFTVRPAYFLPLAYLSEPRVSYAFALSDDGSISVAGNYNFDLHTPFPLDGIGGLGDLATLPGSVNLADMLGGGGVDLALRAEYPVYHNLSIGGSLGHIPLVPAELAHTYSLRGGFEFNKTIEDIISNDFELPDLTPTASYGEDHKAVFRPFKIGVDATYRPFAVRLITLRPELALVFNSIYDTPAYLDLGISGEVNLADFVALTVGTRFEDLVWKERVGLSLNFRIVEIRAGITTQSQRFLKSFQGAGLAVDLGVRMGF
jgi:hypothetical protein